MRELMRMTELKHDVFAKTLREVQRTGDLVANFFRATFWSNCYCLLKTGNLLARNLR